MKIEIFPFEHRYELFHIELSLITFKEYFKVMEVSLQEKREDIIEKAFERSRKLQEENYVGDDLEHLYCTINNSVDEIEIEFIQRFRFSVIIQLYAFLETELRYYCKTHNSENNNENSFSKLKGISDLDKIKIVLIKLAKNDISANCHWEFIDNFRKLRNCIVHSNGIILRNDRNFNSIKAFSKENFDIKKYEENYIVRITEVKFIDLCFKNIESFLTKIVYQH